MDVDYSDDSPLPSGVAGLDDILRGGFPPDCLYMLSGLPGAGKTTLGLQFLLEGASKGESCLYVTLSETQKEIAKGGSQPRLGPFEDPDRGVDPK